MSSKKVFTYTGIELETLINQALIKALPDIREDIDIEKVGKRVSEDIFSSKKSEEIPFNDMSIKQLRLWAQGNDIEIPDNYSSKTTIRNFLKKIKTSIDDQKRKLVWYSKKYYTDDKRAYIYTENAVAIAKFKPEGGITTLINKDVETLQRLKIRYKILSSREVKEEIHNIRSRREKELAPSPSPSPSPAPSPAPTPTPAPAPTSAPAPTPTPAPTPSHKKEPIVTIEDVESEDLYRTGSETEDVGGVGIISEEQEDDGDIISDMEREFKELIEDSPSITRKEYIQFWTAHIVKQIPLSIPKIAKASDLTEDKTAEILMSLEKLDKKYPNVQKEIRDQKSRGLLLTYPKEKPVRRKFKKQK